MSPANTAANTTTQPRRRRHTPLRRCVVCRNSRPQHELLRLYRDEAGTWQFDLKRKAGGRGAWLCQDKASCHRVKALRRFFKQDAERVAKDAENIRTALGFEHGEVKHGEVKHGEVKHGEVKQAASTPNASTQVAPKPAHTHDEKGG